MISFKQRERRSILLPHYGETLYFYENQTNCVEVTAYDEWLSAIVESKMLSVLFNPFSEDSHSVLFQLAVIPLKI